MRLNSSALVFERGVTSSGPASLSAADLSSGRSSASTIADKRSTARANAAWALHPGLRPHRRHDGDGILDGIEGDHQRRPHEDCIGNADRVGTGRPQILHQANHVIAEIAENAGGHRRQRIRQRDAAFGDECAQRLERRRSGRRKRVGIILSRAVDFGALAVGAKNDVGFETDDRIAPAHLAAFNRFKQKTYRR